MTYRLEALFTVIGPIFSTTTRDRQGNDYEVHILYSLMRNESTKKNLSRNIKVIIEFITKT